MPKKYSVDAPPGMKSCPDCGETKPVEQFGKNNAHRDRLMTYCKSCATERAKATARKYPERTKATAKAYREANPAARSAAYRRWYVTHQEHLAVYRAAHAEERLGYCRVSRDRHRETIQAVYRERYAANPIQYREKTRRWQRANPDKVRQQLQRRKALKLLNSVEPVSYDEILLRDRWICGLCAKKVESRKELHFDHITPLSKQGAHADWNVQVSHKLCNLRKGNKLIGQPRLPI